VPRTLIANARLLTLHPGAPFLAAASLVLDDGIVAAVLDDPEPRDVHAERIDAAGGLVFPGLINAHTHCYSSLARGMDAGAAAIDFAALLETLWWRLDACLEAEDVQLSAMLAARDSLRLGVTTLFDHHASYGCIAGSLEQVASGLEQVGVRSVVCFEISDRAGKEAARQALAENVRQAETGWSPPFRLGTMLGLHASFTLSDATLEEAAAVARTHGLAVHVHGAEDGVDRVSGARQGTGVVERLTRFGLLEPGAIVAHGVHLDAAEIRALAAQGVAIAHNARSNMNNGVGRADPGAMARAGAQVVLGTDAYGAGLLAEARAAILLQRQQPRLGSGDVIAECLLQGNPSLAAGRLPLLGRILPGAPADVVVTRYVPPTPCTEANAWAHLLHGEVEPAVRAVFVAGERVLDEARCTLVDEVELGERCRERAALLWERFRRATPRWQTSRGGAGDSGRTT